MSTLKADSGSHSHGHGHDAANAYEHWHSGPQALKRWFRWFAYFQLVLIGLTGFLYNTQYFDKSGYDYRVTEASETLGSTQNIIQGYQYQFSFYAAVTGLALAAEFFVTGQFTTELAGIVINLGAILLGFAAKYLDLGVPHNYAIARSQAAFAILVGVINVAFGVHIIKTTPKFDWENVKPDEKSFANTKKHFSLFVSVLSIVTIGLGAAVLGQVVNDSLSGTPNKDTSLLFHLAMIVSLVSNAVILGVAHGICYSGHISKGFLALAALFGILTLGFASSYNKEDGQAEGQTISTDFTDTSLAWQSFNVITGGILFFGAIVVRAKQPATPDSEKTDKPLKVKFFMFLGLCVTLVFFALTASRTDEYYVQQGEENWQLPVTTDPPAFTFWTSPTTSDGSVRSSVAFPVAFFASCIAIARVIADFKSDKTSGIAALTFAWGVTLLGWASAFANDYLSTEELWDQTPTGGKIQHNKDTKSWEGIALVVAILAIIGGYKSLKHSKQAPAAVAPAQTADAQVVWHAAKGDNNA